MLNKSPNQNQIKDLISLYNKKSFHQVIFKSSDLLNLFPNSYLLFNIQGASYAGLKDFNSAIISYEKAVNLNPNFADGYNNLGIVYHTKGDLKSAIRHFNKALKIKPKYAEALNNLGVAYKELGNFELALENYNEALVIKPYYPEAINNIGNLLKDKGLFNEAIEKYNQAISINPKSIDAYINKCEVLEKLNKLSELEKVINDFKNKVNVTNHDLSYYEALLKYRIKEYNTCAKILKHVKLNQVSEKLKPHLLSLLGNYNHKQNQFSIAFENFSIMNGIVKKSKEYSELNSKSYIDKIRKRKDELKKISRSIFQNKIDSKLDKQPVFLIGFPRSGTTLLDTVLRTHSAIEVVEEKLMITNINQKITNTLTLTQIENLNTNLLNETRKLYFSELSKYTNINNNSCTIDKFPLNILDLPLINKIFPDGNYILALRHPLDCILSCFMQNFKLNVAMANMLDIDQIVKFYSLTMEIFELCHKRYNLNVHKIRYEDLVDNFENEVNSLLQFLNLKWEKGLVKFHLTARKRKFINTPSYSQVIQPIYKHSSYKWKNYSQHLKQYFNIVEPWVSKYGYESLK